MYFSRSVIPFERDAAINKPPYLRHLGIYAYRAGFLSLFPQLPVAPIEAMESLEQLRALWHGHAIAVHITDQPPGPGVDTPEDLERVRALLTA
jgi:3-deoxy-manno-octulosonate cytidylyltransferase (CMP-KDO synthetase)